jgi:hypothetical protein
MKRKATKSIRDKLAKLDMLASLPGTPHEGQRARELADKIRARYDVTAPDQDRRDIFAGVFLREAANNIPIAVSVDPHLDNAVKWAIEERTGIPCNFRAGQLCAAAAPATARKLEAIAVQVTGKFAALWAEYESKCVVWPCDYSLFVRALYDGMMNDERPAGEPLQSRGTPPKRRQRKEKSQASELNVHPYSVAVSLGRMIRIDEPSEAVVAALRERISAALPPQTNPEPKGAQKIVCDCC